MKVTLSTIKRLIDTGAAIDVTNGEIDFQRAWCTTVFYSVGVNGLNGIVLRDDINGQLYAVAGRVSNLFILAG